MIDMILLLGKLSLALLVLIARFIQRLPRLLRRMDLRAQEEKDRQCAQKTAGGPAADFSAETPHSLILISLPDCS